MSSIFTNCKAKNNEEYKKILKRRRMVCAALSLLGILTVAVGIAATKIDFLPDVIEDYQKGFFCGLGTGLAAGGLAVYIRLTRRLRDEEQLKKYRIKETDERNIEINNRALRAAAALVLATLYLLMLTWGLFCALVSTVCELAICVFLIGHLLFRMYYERKI